MTHKIRRYLLNAKLLFCYIYIINLSSFATILNAQEPDFTKVVAGMPYNEVLKLLGPPKEKVQQEAKRIDLWQYNNWQIVFKNGRVFKSGMSDKSEAGLLALKQEPLHTPQPKVDSVEAAEMEQILNEIIGTTNKSNK